MGLSFAPRQWYIFSASYVVFQQDYTRLHKNHKDKFGSTVKHGKGKTLKIL